MTAARGAAFVAVGALGFVLQIALVVALTALATPPLVATALAVEGVILHNFAWHERWTWRDRAAAGARARLQRLARFNASAGLVSLPGNLLVTFVLVQYAHAPVAIANVIAVGLLSAINFVLADRWAFAPPQTPPLHRQTDAGLVRSANPGHRLPQTFTDKPPAGRKPRRRPAAQPCVG